MAEEPESTEKSIEELKAERSQVRAAVSQLFSKLLLVFGDLGHRVGEPLKSDGDLSYREGYVLDWAKKLSVLTNTEHDYQRLAKSIWDFHAHRNYCRAVAENREPCGETILKKHGLDREEVQGILRDSVNSEENTLKHLGIDERDFVFLKVFFERKGEALS